MVSKVAPEDHLQLTDAETLGEPSSDTSWDDDEADEDNNEARQTPAANHGKKPTRLVLLIAKWSITITDKNTNYAPTLTPFCAVQSLQGCSWGPPDSDWSWDFRWSIQWCIKRCYWRRWCSKTDTRSLAGTKGAPTDYNLQKIKMQTNLSYIYNYSLLISSNLLLRKTVLSLRETTEN